MNDNYRFLISAFGDEIADDLETQLAVLKDLGISYLDLRGVWDKNVLDLSDEEVDEINMQLALQTMAISSIGSPIGKSLLADPIEKEVQNLRRINQIAKEVGTRNVRIFSFYPTAPGEESSSDVQYDEYLDDVIERLKELVAVAEEVDLLLMLENEKQIVGDTVDRCHAILQAIDSPHLTFVWDPANFVEVGEAQVTERGWPLLGDRIGYVHIKDCVLGGEVKAAGEGDGQVGELLARLADHGYRGFLALEPHLKVAGPSSGFSGPDGMRYAHEHLQNLLGRIS